MCIVLGWWLARCGCRLVVCCCCLVFVLRLRVLVWVEWFYLDGCGVSL